MKFQTSLVLLGCTALSFMIPLSAQASCYGSVFSRICDGIGDSCSSGDYFGPRTRALSPSVSLAADFRERNGYYRGDYFGPKG